MSAAVTVERPAPGVAVAQPARGYRYAADPFLLGGFALDGGTPARALDLGTGCGLIPLLLARHGVEAIGVDAQDGWAAFWARSLAASSVHATLRVQRAQQVGAMQVDLVTCNPPYYPRGRGPLPRDPLKAAAHVELDGGLPVFVAAAARALSPRGRACFVLPSSRQDELVASAAVVRLLPRRVVRVGARRVLVELAADGGAAAALQVSARGAEVDRLYALILGRATGEVAPAEPAAMEVG